MFWSLSFSFSLRGVGRKSFELTLLVFSLLLSVLLVQSKARADHSLPQPSATAAQNTQEIAALELGKPIERELAGGQKHSYQITLAEGQYAFVVVEQRGIDVLVQLLGTNGTLIAGFDFEVRNEGNETIVMVAETAGSYRLIVRGKNPGLPAGRYEIRLIEVRAATERDRWLHESARLRTESARLSDAGNYDEALPLAEKRSSCESVYLERRIPIWFTIF